MDESFVDRQYRLRLFQYLDEKPEFTGTPYKPKWQLECPLCGAKKSTLVAMPDRQTYKFFCSKSHRSACGIACEFPVLLKVWNQPLWFEYLAEREEEGTVGAGWNVPKVSLMNPTPRPRKKRRCRNRQVPNQPRNGSAPGAGRSC